MSAAHTPQLDFRYRPPMWYALLLLLLGAGMLGGGIYLVLEDPKGAFQYIGTLGILGLFVTWAGLAMLLYPFVTPARFRLYKNHLEYHHPFTFRLVQVPFAELRKVEFLVKGNSMSMIQLHRKRGGARLVYPRWFESKEQWQQVLGEIARWVER